MEPTLKVRRIDDTLRGESPMSGVPSLVIELGTNGTMQLTYDDYIKLLLDSVGEIITFTGEPFRQLDVLSDFIKRGKHSVVIETSGRMLPEFNKRQLLVPIVSSTVLVVKPRVEIIQSNHYDWIRQYRFENAYWKFVWQGDEVLTTKLINDFFHGSTQIQLVDEIERKRIIVISRNANDMNECREVWNFCLKYRLRYSGREYRRLF